MKQLISLLIENKPGALMRVAGVLTARGYNIESLTVARTLDSTLSSMTIVVDVDPVMQFLLIKQIKRLINVVEVIDLTESRAVCREMALIKIETTSEKHTALLKEIDVFGARIAETDSLSYTFEATGTSDELDFFISLLHSHGTVKMIRSGAIAISGSSMTKSDDPLVKITDSNSETQETLRA